MGAAEITEMYNMYDPAAAYTKVKVSSNIAFPMDLATIAADSTDPGKRPAISFESFFLPCLRFFITHRKLWFFSAVAAARKEFEGGFKSALALTIPGVDESAIIIDDIVSGSVVVHFSIVTDVADAEASHTALASLAVRRTSCRLYRCAATITLCRFPLPSVAADC